MKKIFLLFLLMPTFVFASAIECTSGNYKLNDEFKCVFSSTPSKNFSSLTGSLETPDNIKCDKVEYFDGITEASKYENNKFSVSGESKTGEFITFNCKVDSEVKSLHKEKIRINDLTYDGVVEKVESNDINLIPSNFLVNKPKNTDKPSLLIDEITAEGVDFVFSKYITDYSIEVTNDIEKFNPVIKMHAESSTYEISNTDLDVGDNVIYIMVTDQEDEKNTYTFNIKRLEAGEEKYVKESDSSVKNIEIKGQNFKFSKDKKTYVLNLTGNVSKLDINVTTNYDKETVTISGNNNLKNKSRIVIKVVSEDGTSETKYNIDIKKKFDFAENKDLIISIIIGILVVSLIIVILVTNNKKNKQIKKEMNN